MSNSSFGTDPEQRIAQLERGAATSRSFVAFAAPPATKQMMKYTYAFMAVGIAFVGAINVAFLLVGSILDSATVWQVGGAVMYAAFLLLARPAYGAFQRRMYREKKVLIGVTRDGLSVNTRPGEVFSFRDAQLGRWTLPGYGVATKGTALHLRCGQHTFIIGGRDHRTGAPLDAAPVDNVDAWMWAAEFDDLLTDIGVSPSDVHRPTAGQPTRCLLLPNPTRKLSYSVFGMFKNTATALRLNANPPQPKLAIDVGNDQISVIDLNSNALIGSAALAHVSATPGESTLSLPRVGQQTTPVLVLAIPNAQPLTIGCPNTYDAPQTSWSGRTKFNHRFTWRGDVRAEPEPEFVVTDADWLTLVERLGLAPYLNDNGRTERDGNGPVWTQRSAWGEAAPLAKPKRKRRWWIFVVIFVVMMFIAPSAMIWVSSNINYSRELKDQQLTASRERQFALPFTDLRLPHGVAVDGAGNVYVTDTHTNRVLKLAAGSNTQTVLPFTGLDLSDGGVIDADTAGIAVDTAGDVYVTDSGHNRVLKLAAGSTTQSVLPFRRVSIPRGVAVDTAGTVYVVDFNGRIVKLARGESTQTALPSTGGGNLSDVAVDTAGTVYANVFRCPGKSSCSSTLLKLPAGSNTWVALPSTGRSQTSVTVDTAGNVYVLALGETGSVMKLTPGSQRWTELPGAHRFVDPMGLAVDTHGNVYVTDHTGSREPLALFGIWKMGDDDAHGFVFKLPVG